MASETSTGARGSLQLMHTSISDIATGADLGGEGGLFYCCKNSGRAPLLRKEQRKWVKKMGVV